MSEGNTSLNNRVVIRIIVLAAIFLFIAGGWYWWRNVYNSPNNVFWGMMNNNLITSSVTRHISQTAEDRSLDQYIRLQFGALNATESLVTVKQTTTSGESIVKTNSIGTLHNDYSRYIAIHTPEKNKDGKPIDASQVVGVWGKTADPKTAQEANAQFFKQSVLTIMPFGYFGHDARQALIDQMRSKNIYDYSAEAPKSTEYNGQSVYVYKVAVRASAYVELMQSFMRKLGLGDAGLNPSAYANSPPLKVELTVDKVSRQLLKVSYPDGQQTETIADQNLDNPISLPESTIPITELQTKVQNIVQ